VQGSKNFGVSCVSSGCSADSLCWTGALLLFGLFSSHAFSLTARLFLSPLPLPSHLKLEIGIFATIWNQTNHKYVPFLSFPPPSLFSFRFVISLLDSVATRSGTKRNRDPCGRGRGGSFSFGRGDCRSGRCGQATSKGPQIR